jgi:hypothetical protein
MKQLVSVGEINKTITYFISMPGGSFYMQRTQPKAAWDTSLAAHEKVICLLAERVLQLEGLKLEG